MASEHSVVDLDVTGIAHGGVAVARLDGRVVFVTDAIPGERVRARITQTRHDAFWRADTVEVVEASEHRREHVWDAASLDRDPRERAGGAEFGHIDLSWQRRLKAQVLTEAMSRFADLDVTVPVEGVPGDDERHGLRWRTRVTLHVDRSGRVGPYAARSHRVVPIEDLPLATPEVVAAAALGTRRRGALRLEVVSDDEGAVAIPVRPHERRAPGSPRRHSVAGRVYRNDERGFWQVHRAAADVLVHAVLDAVDGDRLDVDAEHFDLYGGVGLFAGALADRFGSALAVTTVEADEAATDFARSNLADLPGVKAVTSSVDRFVAPLDDGSARGSVVVLDPPRKGAGREVVAAITRAGAAQVIYVACDPVALARDVGEFRARGYELESLRAFDLFPHTHHVEAVARLVPTNPSAVSGSR